LNESDGAPLTEKLFSAITNHLNQDHQEDLLACAQAGAAIEWAEHARAIGLDATGIDLEVSNNQQVQPLRLDFPAPAKGVLSLRRTLGTMIRESRAKLGWAEAVDDD
jgi:hypothetical protein